MIAMRNNKYIKKLLDNSLNLKTSDRPNLNLSQIEWQLDNKEVLCQVISRRGIIYPKYYLLYLLRTPKGKYRLASPSCRKDGILPCYLYDIVDIEEFLKRYSIVISAVDSFSDGEAIYNAMQNISDGVAKGFIETRIGSETQVYEVI